MPFALRDPPYPLHHVAEAAERASLALGRLSKVAVTASGQRTADSGQLRAGLECPGYPASWLVHRGAATARMDV